MANYKNLLFTFQSLFIINILEIYLLLKAYLSINILEIYYSVQYVMEKKTGFN